MRRTLILTTAAVLVGSIGTAWATHEEDCIPGIGGQVRCRIVVHPLPPVDREKPGGGGGGGGSAPEAKDVLYWPILIVGPDGWCISWRSEVFPNAALSARAAEAERRWLMLARSYRLCPGHVRPPTVRPAPEAVARQVVEEIDLPAPLPSIAPGFAVTGKPAYLETGTHLRPPAFQRPTDLGRITVTATGEYVVDWGDGSAVERYSVEGGPWPDGRISHVYTHVARYEVTVTVEWIAHWEVDGVRGTITGLRTSGTIADFEVRQIQAVRDR